MNIRMIRAALLVSALGATACGGDGGGADPEVDGSRADGGRDAGRTDGAINVDGGFIVEDGGVPDDGDGSVFLDADIDDDGGSTLDGGAADSGPSPDAGTLDGGRADSGGLDGGTVDSGPRLDAGSNTIGAPCTSDAACGEGFCASDAAGFPGGYCFAGCATDADCGPGANCSSLGGTTFVCLDACAALTDCRGGYQCTDLDDSGAAECWRPAASVAGGACTDNDDCGIGGCLTEADFGWEAGYCTASCQIDADCAANDHCGLFDEEGNGLCLHDCSSNADCRTTGYSCNDADDDAVRECAPSATGTGAVGTACSTSADCAGGDRGFCFSEIDDFFQGYCALEGCVAGGSGATGCPSGSHCAVSATASSGVCLDDCSSDSDCRSAGYACIAGAGADTTRECLPAATGGGAPGAACIGTWECAGGAAGFCAREGDDGSFAGGLCLLDCSTSSCPTGSSCVALGPTSEFCLDDCASDGECRAGYACRDLDASSDVCFLP